MSLNFNLKTQQTQRFKVTQVAGFLRMSTLELAQHLAEMAAQNPVLKVRYPNPAMIARSSTADILEQVVASEVSSLYDHVSRELSGLLSKGGLLERVTLAFIENLEPSGWLGRSLDDISKDVNVSVDTLEQTLAVIQRQVEPAGLFARDLQECLRLQLEDTDRYNGEIASVVDHLKLIEISGLSGLVKATGLPRKRVEACMEIIARLDPKPGVAFSSNPSIAREPDVSILVDGARGLTVQFPEGCCVDLTQTRPATGQMTNEFRDAVAKAKAIKDAIDMRRSAMEQVVHAIAAHQRAFFAQGREHLVPLTMAQIAEVTGFHVSTVSRVVNGLLIESAFGILSARELFVQTASSQALTPKTKITARIRSLIRQERDGTPLSDCALTDKLAGEGLAVSRRVVAKYRQEMGIPSAAERRRLSA